MVNEDKNYKDKDLKSALQPSIEMIQDVSLRCGLKEDTVVDLLEKGWTYLETIREPAKWIQREL